MDVPPAATACDHGHVVEFYETDEFLSHSVAAFLEESLAAGGSAVVVATAEHRALFDRDLAAAGIDLAAARTEDRYLDFDAAEVLATFMTGAGPDGDRFAAHVGGVLDRAAHGGRRVRVYGEMVALLWGEGRVPAAIALEDLWNDLAHGRVFELLCAYPLHILGDPEHAEAFRRVCDQHSRVVPAESFPAAADPAAQARAIAELQRELTTVRAELGRLRRHQEALVELAYRDPLTGIANRRAFDADLQREWALAARGEVDSFLVVADIDDFKALNDRLGHLAGDRALQGFADALAGAARGTDVIARIGGDEFAVLLLRCDERAVATFRDRLITALDRRTWPGGELLTASLGHASLQRAPSPDDALLRADLAMLARKRVMRGACA